MNELFVREEKLPTKIGPVNLIWRIDLDRPRLVDDHIELSRLLIKQFHHLRNQGKMDQCLIEYRDGETYFAGLDEGLFVSAITREHFDNYQRGEAAFYEGLKPRLILYLEGLSHNYKKVKRQGDLWFIQCDENWEQTYYLGAMTHAIEIRNVPPRLPRDSDKLDYSLSRLRDVVREPIFHTNHLLTGQICQLESSTNVWDPWRRRTYYYHITVLIISGSVTHPQHRTLVLNEPHIVARNEPELRD